MSSLAGLEPTCFYTNLFQSFLLKKCIQIHEIPVVSIKIITYFSYDTSFNNTLFYIFSHVVIYVVSYINNKLLMNKLGSKMSFTDNIGLTSYRKKTCSLIKWYLLPFFSLAFTFPLFYFILFILLTYIYPGNSIS